MWEAVHILDGLLKNKSVIQPNTLHADTQGQSEPVFGLCRLLGIKRMPRMRGLGDTILYRPAEEIRYAHIDALFTGEIDWELIATHQRDMIQVMLSIQARRVMPSMLLRKLGIYSRRSRLYRAFQHRDPAHHPHRNHQGPGLQRLPGLGVVRRPGGQERRPRRAEKQLKYASLVSKAVMLSNVDDLTRVPSVMAADGHLVTPALVAALSPYMRRHVLRFGRYALDMETPPEPLNPEPLNPQPLPFENVW